ncbi:MAG: enoyl-CoA hydratase/isomerase family protein [Candidatus Krumholzibacteriia bacterium]
MAHEVIKVNELHDGQVVEIILGPAPANIVTARVIRELSLEFDRLTGGPVGNRKLIVLTGAGEHFSYGASVEEHKADSVGEMLPQFHRLIGGILDSDIPTVAKVSGLCLGGGFELALACAMIFSAGEAKFGVPEIQLGVFPPVASVLLPYKTGESAAAKMILTGAKIPAPELHRLGVVQVFDGSLDDALERFIEKQVLPKSASSLRFACRAARSGIRRHYHSCIEEVERLYLDDLMATTDANEGIDAFLAKRPPKWVDA